MNAAIALRIIRGIAAETGNIVIVTHAKERQASRNITRRQVELCVQKGVIVEGPFLNTRGHWQANLLRQAAGEAITCVVAIDQPRRLIVVTVL